MTDPSGPGAERPVMDRAGSTRMLRPAWLPNSGLKHGRNAHRQAARPVASRHRRVTGSHRPRRPATGNHRATAHGPAINNRVRLRVNQLQPPQCPMELDDPDGVDGTVTWGPADVTGLEQTGFLAWELEVRMSGRVTTPVSYETKDGGTKSGTVTSYIASGAIDMSKTPAVADFGD